jgi:hypothetical protein
MGTTIGQSARSLHAVSDGERLPARSSEQRPSMSLGCSGPALHTGSACMLARCSPRSDKGRACFAHGSSVHACSLQPTFGRGGMHCALQCPLLVGYLGASAAPAARNTFGTYCIRTAQLQTPAHGILAASPPQPQLQSPTTGFPSRTELEHSCRRCLFRCVRSLVSASLSSP